MKIPMSEEIATNRCRLRFPSRQDFPHIWSASRVPGFNDGMVWDPPSTMEELEAPQQRNHDNWIAGRAFTWTIESTEESVFIGRIAIRRTAEESEWSIGYWTHPTLQKRGFASEVTIAVIEFGFSKLNALRITAAHATWNEASGKVLSRAGMKKTGVNPEGFMKKGIWVEEYEYEILPGRSPTVDG